MTFYQKLATSTLYQIIARIASSGASFLVTILISRHFGIASYGDYAKVTAFVATFYLLADFGLNALFLQKEDANEHFHDLFYMRIGLSLVLIFVINIVAFFLPYNTMTGIGFSSFVKMAIALFSATILTESIMYSAFAIFQKKYMYQQFMVATLLGSFTTLTLVGVCILSGFSLFWIFAAFVIGGIVEAISSLFLSGEFPFPIGIHILYARKLFYETIPIAIMLVFNLVYFRIDTFLLAFFRPSSDVGIYDLSYRVFDFLIALPLFLSNVLYPKLIDEEKNNRNVKPIVVIYVFRFLLLGIFTGLPFWLASPLLFYVIKPTFLRAVPPFRILLLSLPFFFATSILQWILIVKKQQKYLSFLYLFLTIGNIFLNLLFIPQFGYIASAIITDVGELVVLVLLGWRVMKME